MADRSQIEEIKDKLDIVQLAEGYLKGPFRRSGRNVFTHCPFHSEKSPSFSLNSDLGLYKCFGCGESGDVFSFIEKMEGLDFAGAVETAAGKAGVTLKKSFSAQNDKYTKEKEEILKANSLTAQYFHYLLTKDKSGESAREYCERRKIKNREINEFQIGFAPNGFENLKKFLSKKNFELKKLVEWGLLVEKNGRIYDKFRNRLIFPIFNIKGEVIGFSGRTLEKDGIPKYLNSPETILYKKSNIVYGLYQSKESIRKKGFAIIAEGNIEPLTSRNAEIDNVVVPMGTSLTLGQLKIIRRYCDTIYFAFDSDNAGKSALLRALKLAYSLEFKIKAIDFSPYKDPDEMISEDINKWINAVTEADEVTQYLIKQFRKEFDTTSALGKTDFIKKLRPFIIQIKDEIMFDHYVKQLSQILSTEESTIRKVLTKGEIDKEFDSIEKIDSKIVGINNMSHEEYVVALIINFPNLNLDYKDLQFNEVLSEIISKYEKYKSIREINNELSIEAKEELQKIIVMNIPEDMSQEQIRSSFLNLRHKLINKKYKNELKLIQDKIGEAESKGEDTSDYLQMQSELIIKLKKTSET